MVVQATLVDAFAAGAEAAGWSPDEVNARLRRIVRSTPTGEIRVLAPGGGATYSSGPSDGGDGRSAAEGRSVTEHPIAPRASDGALYKYVEAVGAGSGRVVRVGLPIDDGSLVSPRFDAGAAG